MLTIKQGRVLFLIYIFVLFSILVLIEFIIYWPIPNQDCLPSYFVECIWPSIELEKSYVSQLMPDYTCSFYRAKRISVITSQIILAVSVAITARNFSLKDSLFYYSKKPFISLFFIGIILFATFRYFPIFNKSVIEYLPIRRFLLIRSSVASPLISAALIAIGLLGFSTKFEINKDLSNKI